jgi:hypothetical protein
LGDALDQMAPSLPRLQKLQIGDQAMTSLELYEQAVNFGVNLIAPLKDMKVVQKMLKNTLDYQRICQ